jgi:C-terminal processing protease CtpA/Prc
MVIQTSLETVLDRITTQDLQKYTTVNNDSEHSRRNANCDSPVYDDEEAGLSRPRLPPNENATALRFRTWLIVLGLLGAIFIGILSFERRIFKSSIVPLHSSNTPNGTLGADGVSSVPVSSSHTVQYDTSVAEMSWNPFDLKLTGTEDASLLRPSHHFPDTFEKDESDEQLFGYITQPDIVNGTAVFVSEGDVYWTRITNAAGILVNTDVLSAVKLTSTTGQVQTPKINPIYPYLIAYTADYQATRDVYLLDLRKTGKRGRAAGNQAVQRLTYSDSLLGVNAVVGWKDEGRTLLYGSLSVGVGLRDSRLYEIALEQQTGDSTTVLETRPVPLTQAIEGVSVDSCLYFVRFKQYSSTGRYVGGTAEQLWAYCDGETFAVPMTTNYPGTSKTPQVMTVGDQRYLVFMSDRGSAENGEKWIPTTMNLWAAPLPTKDELYAPSFAGLIDNTIVQLTSISCQFNGMALREYALDVVTGNILLRIGADLHWLAADTVQQMLESQKPGSTVPPHLPIQVNSDFHEQQERLIDIDLNDDLTDADIFETDFGLTGFLMTVRGQLWVAPVIADASSMTPFQGSGQNLPARRYRVIPGAMTGGATRVLQALKVPMQPDGSGKVLSLVLATDPVSPTGELGFYIVEVQPSSMNSFVDLRRLPEPFVGGCVSGGSARDGGLGTVKKGSVVMSPCGRRFGWADMDDRVCVMTIPIYLGNSTVEFHCLPEENDLGEPMAGTLAELNWSPGGRYLAVMHHAKNQMKVISIVDCGDPDGEEAGEVADIQIGRAVQVTSNRFNSYDMYWGKSRFDILLHATISASTRSMGLPAPDDVATTLFFISDRDIVNDVSSPWGSRAPMPHFPRLRGQVFALPLLPKVTEDEEQILMSRYAGGGGMEVFAGEFAAYQDKRTTMMAAAQAADGGTRRLLEEVVTAKLSKILDGRPLTQYERATLSRMLSATASSTSPFPKDAELNLPIKDPSLAQWAYRLAHIPAAAYLTILSQTDDGSLAMIQSDGMGGSNLILFASLPFPFDDVNPILVSGIGQRGLSSCRKYIFVVTPKGRYTRVVPNTMQGLAGFAGDTEWDQQKVDTSGMAISVWPALEYRQMYNDAWRMLRDYFYDPNLHGVDWKAVHDRYEPLVQRCSKRQELDDVMSQMSAELSALHTYVYIGEFSTPDVPPLGQATLAAGLKRIPEWNGFMVTEVPERDPDFNTIDGNSIYSPLSDRALRLTGQRGLQVGDVILAVNGESVMQTPDINMLLRGTMGRSIRLEVLRLASNKLDDPQKAEPEPLITVPIDPASAYMLRVNAWEWKTRQKAKQLAADAGFTVGYVHLQSMHSSDEDAFARAFYPDYDADALIIDVRHNDGGFIDSWILDSLQRKAWMFWTGRGDKRYGSMDWDEQYAFRGKVVILQDEYTASNAEGLCRGVSELGLGRLIGKRTWGGGIWGSSTNFLVDGGIATAPQWGTFNAKFGWGGGVEMTGVSPDIEVDNDPRMAFDGKDSQLERAIVELQKWLNDEPIPEFRTPGERPDKSLRNEACPV